MRTDPTLETSASSSPQPTPRRRRRPIVWLLRILLVASLLVGLAALSLRSSTTRQFLLTHLSKFITSRTSLHVQIEDFQLALGTPRLEIEGITVHRDATADPFLTVGQGIVDGRWHELLSRRPRLRSIEIVAPAFDLEAPLPESGEDKPPPDPDASLDLGIDVGSIRISEGSVVQQWSEPRGWLSAWRLVDLAGEGSYEAAKLRFASQDGSLQMFWTEDLASTLDAHPMTQRFEPRSIDLQLRLQGELPSTFTIEELSAYGEGLELEASGTVDAKNDILHSLFELYIEPGRLLPGVAEDAGPVIANGDLDLLRLQGHLVVDAERLPLRVLEPWIEADLYRQIEVPGSHLRLHVDGQLAGSRPESIRGKAQLAWQDADETLLTLEGRILEPLEERLQVTVEAEVLPALEGRTHLEGRLSATDWRQLAEATIESSQLRLEMPRVLAFRQQLQDRWPNVEALAAPWEERLLEEIPASAKPGPVNLLLTVQGALRDPKAELELDGWNGALQLTAEGYPMRQQGTAALKADRLNLGSLRPLAGLELTGRLDVDLQARLDADSWQLEGTGSGSSLAWRREATLADLSWSADLEGKAPTSKGDPDAWIPTVASIDAQLADARWLQQIAEDTADDTGEDASDSETSEDAPGDATAELTAEEEAAEVPSAQLAITTNPSSEPPPPALDIALDRLQIHLELAQRGPAWKVELVGDSGGWQIEGLAEAPMSLTQLYLELDSQGRLQGGQDLTAMTADRAGFEALGLENFRWQGVAENLLFDPQQPPVDLMRWQLTAENERWSLQELVTRWNNLQVAASGHATWRQRIEDIHLETTLQSPDSQLSSLGADFDIAAGVLQLRVDDVVSDLGEGTLEATVPLANLGRIAGLASVLEALPIATVGGPIDMQLDVPALASSDLLELMQQPPSPWELRSGIQGQLRFDLARPEEGRGDITLSRLQLDNGPQHVTAEEDLRVRWRGSDLELEPANLLIGHQPARVDGSAQLVWSRDAATPWPVPEVTRLEGHLNGDVGLSFIRPYLPKDGRVEGSVAVQATLSGSLEAPRLEASFDGADGRLLLSSPYAVEVTQPKAAVRLVDDYLHIDSASAMVNGGLVVANGGLDPQGNFNAEGVLDALRLRLDYGVIAQLSGNFKLSWPSTGRPKITSNILVERAVLRHAIDLDSLLLSELLAPPEIVGLEGTPRPEDDIDLDLSIATIDGLRVRNNLADLRATWNPIRVRGSVLNPLIQGDIDVESGGLVSVYGQTLRLDRAQVTFSGIPGTAPVFDIATTSSLEDPTVGQGRSDLFASQSSSTPESVEDRLASGLATYYGNILASRLGSGLGSRTRLSIRPVLIFGESDPQARLALTRDLSAHLALVAAISLQDTQGRTYVLDVHNLPVWPSFVGQAFTNEDGQAGLTLQQSWEPGKQDREEADGELEIRQVDLQAPDTLPTKKLRRVIDSAIGERVDDGADFDVEIDVTEALLNMGYNAARVKVDLVHRGGDPDEVDLVVVVEPGVRSNIVFKGNEPPRDQRASIARLYRPTHGGDFAFEEMRQRTREVFRAQGYPAPEIEISRRPLPDEDGQGREEIIIETRVGQRWPLGTPVVVGSDPEVATLLQEQFATKLQRMELALGTEAAKERVLSTLRGLGFVDPQWVSARYDAEQKAPVVEVEPGRRRYIAKFEVQGLSEDSDFALGGREALRVGSPLRLDILTRQALALESRMRNEGYSEAQVMPSVEVHDDDELRYDVLVEVNPGPAHHLRQIEVSGEQKTREGWVQRIADLPDGTLLRERDISLARRRLLATGIFRRVQIERQPPEVSSDSEEGDIADIQPTDLTIEVQERPRFRLSAGLRWESSVGTSAVFEAVDRSFTGRGSTVGFRALVGEQEQTFKVYTVVPRLLASRNDLELFVEHRNEKRGAVERERLEGSFQLSRRLGELHLVRLYGSYREGVGLETRNPSGPFANFSNPFLGFQWVLGEQQPGELFPRSSFASLDISGSNLQLGAEQDFIRIFSNLQHFYHIPKSRWVWGQSLRLGWAHAFGEPVIDDLRFRTGGEYSVRGYSTESLGPRFELDGQLAALGGEALVVLNQELRFPVWDQLAGLVFLDAGNVWADKDDFGRDLFTAVGLGLRYDSPVGPLRLDLAYPLDRRPDDGELKVYFGFGNIF